VLFKGTVHDNVAKGFVNSQHSLSDEQKMELVQEACRSSNADDFIQQLPQVCELNTFISGVNNSM